MISWDNDNKDIIFMAIEIFVGLVPIIGLIFNASLAQLIVMIVCAGTFNTLAIFVYLDGNR